MKNVNCVHLEGYVRIRMLLKFSWITLKKCNDEHNYLLEIVFLSSFKVKKILPVATLFTISLQREWCKAFSVLRRLKWSFRNSLDISRMPSLFYHRIRRNKQSPHPKPVFCPLPVGIRQKSAKPLSASGELVLTSALNFPSSTQV